MTDLQLEKKGNPYEQALKSIMKYDDLQNIGDIIEKFKSYDLKELDKYYVDNKFITKLSNQGVVALIMVTPLAKASLHVYKTISEMLYTKPYINEYIVKMPEQYQFSIAMRFANSACNLNKGQEALHHDGFNELLSKNPLIYMAPALYLHAQIEDPFTPETQYSKNGRIDTMVLYYLSLNHLISQNFKEAEKLLSRCYILSKSCKDIRPCIIEKLSLASFLNGTPKEVFASYIPTKHFPKGSAGSLWSLTPIDLSTLDSFYRKFDDLIVSESVRRIIIDQVETVSAIPFKDLAKVCGVKQTDLRIYLEALHKDGVITFNTTEDGVVEFTNISYNNQIEAQLKDASQLLQFYKHK